MKKNFVAIVLTALMVLLLSTACGGEATSKTKAAASAKTAEAEVPVEPGKNLDADTEAKSETEGVEDSVDESEKFTLLDVSAEMIDAGVYAAGEDGTEFIFSIFKDPSRTPMASLIIMRGEGSGDMLWGTYTFESGTKEDGITRTVFTISDVYTGGEVDICFGESENNEIYIFDSEGCAYAGEYLTKDDTITYMRTAITLLPSH